MAGQRQLLQRALHQNASVASYRAARLQQASLASRAPILPHISELDALQLADPPCRAPVPHDDCAPRPLVRGERPPVGTADHVHAPRAEARIHIRQRDSGRVCQGSPSFTQLAITQIYAPRFLVEVGCPPGVGSSDAAGVGVRRS